MEIKDYATLKKRLTDGQIRVIEQILDHLNTGTLKYDRKAEPGYKFCGIEDIVIEWNRGNMHPWDFCEVVRDRLLPDGKPTDLGKARAYDLIYR